MEWVDVFLSGLRMYTRTSSSERIADIVLVLELLDRDLVDKL